MQEKLNDAQEDWGQERMDFRARMQQLSRDADNQLAEYKERKVLEMEQIHSKLQDVLDKKNATISQMRVSLETAHARLAANEQDMRKHKLELFEQMKW